MIRFIRKWVAFVLAWTGHGLITVAHWLWPEWH